MIRLKDLLSENYGIKENRVNLMKLEALMEKMLPELTKTDATKLTELCSEVHQLACDMNKIPYQIWNAYPEWPILKAALIAKLMEVKEETLKASSDKFDATTFIKALDELISD
jgi:hypothetical protein